MMYCSIQQAWNTQDIVSVLHDNGITATLFEFLIFLFQN